ncbi:MAG: hypothetical protein FWE68_05395 [Defluviitaleaceae bacterium]|nr:hypothetical protein [Defluviitaleaceae bacterium]
MAKNKTEYLESKYSPEEAQRARDSGLVNLFGTYVTSEESDAYWRKQEPSSVLEPLVTFALLATAAWVVTRVVKTIQWLTGWGAEK